MRLREYFGNSRSLIFYEIQVSNTTLKNVPITDPGEQEEEMAEINYIFFILLGITLIIMMFGCIACCYNDDVCCDFPRIKGCYIVDDGKFMALIVFALHFYDFTSDINLCREIWLENEILNDLLVLIAGVGSILFLLFPYIANLYIAANIKNLIKGNEPARSWFQFHAKTFVFFVVLTGGCYPALLLVSSNVFGMNIFSSGLTQYELKNMAQIRLFATIFLENIPQIALQLLYSAAIQQLSNAVIFAFIASLLSVLTTVLGYCIDRHDENTKVFEYYLVTALNCNQRSIFPATNVEGNKGEITSMSASSVADNQITERERINLLKNKGRRKQLSMDISELFGIPQKNIQIGNSTITKYGLITYIVHLVPRSDLKQMALEKHQKRVSVKEYIDGLYVSLPKEINVVFRKHFDLNEDFDVSLKYNLSMQLRTSTCISQKSMDDIAEMTTVNSQ